MTQNNDYTYHNPVMLQECLDGLNINPEGTYIDITFGGGGHSKAIHQKLTTGRLISFDQDPDAKKNAWEAPNFDFIAANFAFVKNHLRLLGIKQVDGILGDLGVSSHQFDEGERGFSIRGDYPLDMRMNQASEFDAKHIINTYTEDELISILRKYGEVDKPGKVAGTIVRAVSRNKITRTGELNELLLPIAPRKKENKFLAQIYQAIRIEVNNEMDVLEKFLLQSTDILKPKGRLVIMSYHSLEDRLVKNFMKRGSFDGKIEKDFFGNVLKPFTEINRKPISPSEAELEINNRSRSAKLRIAERNDGE